MKLWDPYNKLSLNYLQLDQLQQENVTISNVCNSLTLTWSIIMYNIKVILLKATVGSNLEKDILKKPE